jgi:histidinol dehydrogenase
MNSQNNKLAGSAEELQSAIQIFEAFRADPVVALNEANKRKGVSSRPFLRSTDEISQRAALAKPEDAFALETLTNRLDRVNEQLVDNIQHTVGSGHDTRIRWSPVSRVGFYVPQRLPATAYTFLSAAAAAGVTETVLYTVQESDGELDPLVMWCANKYGAIVLGGPARLGFPALAFGISQESVPGCPLVCGPCGRSLNIVKQISCLLAGVVSDMSAGPSDLAILADLTADWHQIGRDLVSQLEHGPDSVAEIVLIGTAAEREFRSKVEPTIRADFMSKIAVKVVDYLENGIHEINEIAPETAELWLEKDDAMAQLTTCGVVYFRQGSSLGDYGAIGRGCADPTNKLSRAQSGLSPFTFMRTTALVTAIDVESEARAAATRIADYEGLELHSRAIQRGDYASS